MEGRLQTEGALPNASDLILDRVCPFSRHLIGSSSSDTSNSTGDQPTLMEALWSFTYRK